MYDYYLGGKDHFAVDREAAEQILQIAPETADLVKANRAFLRRAVGFLVESGIRQYLDLGTGIPTRGNVNEIVLEAIPDAALVYVDNDPVVCAHARALTQGSVRVHEADLRDPETVLAAARETLNFDEPVGMILAAVLHFVVDDREAEQIMATYRDALAPGSFLVLSHGTQEGLDEEVERAGTEVYRRSSSPSRLRSTAQVTRLFDGFELVEPGVVNVVQWRPDIRPVVRPGAHMLGGVARR